MKHPLEADLALFAGHDLGLVSNWRVGNHVSRCEQCRATVEAFDALRSDTASLGELPSEIGWNRLASEMRANIRLGLAAGECVAGHASLGDTTKASVFSGYQMLLAYAGVIILVVAGLLLQRPAPRLAHAGAVENGRPVLAATRQGVELSEAGASFGLQYGASGQVNYSADMRGAMGARYVDASTGHVMVVNVNLE
jgi:hypothetical protein